MEKKVVSLEDFLFQYVKYSSPFNSQNEYYRYINTFLWKSYSVVDFLLNTQTTISEKKKIKY